MTDWFRMLADLTDAGLNNAEVARRLGVTRYRVMGWKLGSEPRYDDGNALHKLHAQFCVMRVESGEIHM